MDALNELHVAQRKRNQPSALFRAWPNEFALFYSHNYQLRVILMLFSAFVSN